MRRWLKASLLAFAVGACDPADHCRVNDTRCVGPRAQVCGSDQRWADIANCDEVGAYSGGRWACRALEGDAGHTCLPADEDGGVP